MRKCANCAGENASEATICAHCGLPLQSRPGGMPVSLAGDAWAIVSFVIVAAIVIALFLYAGAR